MRACRTSAADRLVYRRDDLSSGSAWVWGSTMARRSAARCGSLLLAALPAARGEVLQAPHAVLLFVQSLLDRLASPAEASLDSAGAATAERRGHLGLERAALVSGEASGPRPNQGVILLNGVVHHGGPAQGETMPDRPRSARYWGGQDSSVRGRFPAAGRLNGTRSSTGWFAISRRTGAASRC